MKRIFVLGLFAIFSTVPAFNAPAEESDDPLAKAPTQYSADLVITPKSRPPLTQHLYIDGNKRRTELDSNGGLVRIDRGDLHKRYVLVARSKSYIEAPLNQSKQGGETMKILEKLGTEEVNGELCDKYSVSHPHVASIPGVGQPFHRSANASKRVIWVGQKTHMMLKKEYAGATVEYKNIKLGPPDASEFEIPADYTKTEQPTLAEVESNEEKSGNESPSPAPSVTADKSDEQNSNGKQSASDKSDDEDK